MQNIGRDGRKEDSGLANTSKQFARVGLFDSGARGLLG